MSHRIIVMWSIPRSVSTSFERMVSERGDHRVFDEPFSRSYYYGPDRLSTRYGEEMPGCTAEQVLADIEEAARDRPVFVKDMAYQAARLLGPDLLARFDNCFLVRDPAATLRPSRTPSASRGSWSTRTSSAVIRHRWSRSGAPGWTSRTTPRRSPGTRGCVPSGSGGA